MQISILNKEKLIRFSSGMISMLIGTTIVLSILVLINDSKDRLKTARDNVGTEIKFNRKKPKKSRNIYRSSR